MTVLDATALESWQALVDAGRAVGRKLTQQNLEQLRRLVDSSERAIRKVREECSKPGRSQSSASTSREL